MERDENSIEMRGCGELRASVPALPLPGRVELGGSNTDLRELWWRAESSPGAQ